MCLALIDSNLLRMICNVILAISNLQIYLSIVSTAEKQPEKTKTFLNWSRLSFKGVYSPQKCVKQLLPLYTNFIFKVKNMSKAELIFDEWIQVLTALLQVFDWIFSEQETFLICC